MTAASLALASDAPAGLCPVCRQGLDCEGECDICSMALHEGKTIEEVRLDVEDTAAWGCRHFGRAEGRRCTCDVVDHVFVQEGPGRGRGARRAGVIHFDVPHKPGCPLAPPTFDWPDVDEDARERVFGYRGRPHHVARLAALLQHELHEREVLDV